MRGLKSGVRLLLLSAFGGLERAWNWICEKRDECDLTLSKLAEMCFFFSAISTSTLDRKKRKRPQLQETRESDESNDESPVNASTVNSGNRIERVIFKECIT